VIIEHNWWQAIEQEVEHIEARCPSKENFSSRPITITPAENYVFWRIFVLFFAFMWRG